MSRNTIRARQITFGEIEALAAADGPDSVEIYKIDEAGFLVPITLTVEPTRSRDRRDTDIPHLEVHRAARKKHHREDENPYRADKDQVVGYKVRVETTSMFGSTQDGVLFTSEEAETSTARLTGGLDPERTRVRLYVADENGEEMPLVGVYGALLTVSVVVADIDPDDLAARAERALRAEFGESLGRQMKILTRPVEDRRVAVYDSVTDTPLAVGILAAEVPMVMATLKQSSVRTEPMSSGLIVGG